MNLRRIFILLTKELRSSANNFLVVFAVVIPVVLSLLVNLVFGEVFSGKPRLGFVDPGASLFVQQIGGLSTIKTSIYSDVNLMKADVEQGIIETGIIIPAEFDEILRQGTPAEITVFTWGETPFKDRLVAETTMAKVIADIAGLQNKINIEIRQLGEANLANLADKMLPIFILMTLLLGGVLVPAVSIIEEKQNRTLTALNVSPARLSEILISKALLGIFIGIATAVVSLALNQSFGDNPLLLVFVLILGTMAASILGVLLGVVIKDMNVLLAVLKSGGLLLLAPGIIDMIPKAPQWIAELFPTYYILNPVIKVAVRSAEFNEISGDLLILLAMIASLLLILVIIIRQQKKTSGLMGA